VLNTCSSFVADFAGLLAAVTAPSSVRERFLHSAEVQGTVQIWRRFGGGSARNRAQLGEPCNLVQFMHTAQIRINTGDCACC
jgi:hypothetical protein